jgi:hypothetical protein
MNTSGTTSLAAFRNLVLAVVVVVVATLFSAPRGN